MVNVEMTNDKSKVNKELKIDKRLSKIIIPESKVQMFIDWWNSDIRFEKTIPHSFNEGYLFINDLFKDMSVQQEDMKSLIRKLAKQMNTTYRQVENRFVTFIEELKTIIIYFKFSAGDILELETYDLSYKIISGVKCQIGDRDEPEDILTTDFSIGDFESIDAYVKHISILGLGILASCMWYIATTTRTTKYIYDNRTPVVTGRKKGVVQVSDTKFIKTPIYDMSKIRTVHVDKLVSRKKGWTYSHAFEVHGHYRHYQSGKVIFIEPFIKGKNKEFKAQKIIIEPELN